METTTAASDVPAVTQKPAEQETPVIPEAPATTKAAQMTRASVSEKSTSSNEGTVSEQPASENTDSEINELPVLSHDGESTAEISESSSESDLSDEKDSADTQTMAQGEIGTSNQKSDSSSLPIIVAVIPSLVKSPVYVVFPLAIIACVDITLFIRLFSLLH